MQICLVFAGPVAYDTVLILAAGCLGILAFYGSVILLCQPKANMINLLIYQSQMLALATKVALNYVLQIWIKHSKIDPFCQGVRRYPSG